MDDISKSKSDIISKSKEKVKYPEGFLKENFQAIRNKLLDTAGSRSRLLNLDQSGRNFVRIVDELPNSLASTLLSEKVMRLTSVPDPMLEELIEYGYLERNKETNELNQLKQGPSEKEWASIKGIHNTYELPLPNEEAKDGRHTDTDVQTLLFEHELNKRLGTLTKDAKTSIDETGNNILFLSIGFLEYSDQAELNGTAQKRLAPLFMIPVSIEKRVTKNLTHYYIKYTGEDVIDNLTLKEKLAYDFQMQLPSVYSQDEDGSLFDPEVYFDQITALLSQKSNDRNISQWRVRRFATLATLSLGKLLMYKDLDPEIWPDEGAALLEHELISSFFKDNKVESNSALRTEVHELDKLATLHNDFPMIEDADSSQMSALIDVLNGESLVIEGPPGTGKSQTITNLIAAALSQKKSILFVAEKQAALDVVKRRLDNAGLGDFCLDLHSDKAQKKKILEAFNRRINNQNTFKYSTSDYDLQVKRYERTRDELQTYVETLNQEWKDTGLTVHQILNAATRYAKSVEPLDYEDIRPEGLNDTNFSRIYLDEQLQKLKTFYDYLKSVSCQLENSGDWTSHPWYGVSNKQLVEAPESNVKNKLRSWNESLERLYDALNKALKDFGVNLDKDIDLEIFYQWTNEWKDLPVLQGKEIFTSFKHIQECDLPEIRMACSQIKQIADSYNKLSKVFHRSFLENLSQSREINGSLEILESLGVSNDTTFDTLLSNAELLEQVTLQSKILNESRISLNQSINTSTRELLTPDIAGINELACFTNLLSSLPTEYINHRCDEYDDEAIDDSIKKLKLELIELDKQHKALEVTFITNKLPEPKIIRNYAKLSSESSIFSFLKKDWREAREHFLNFTVDNKANFKSEAENLEKAAKFLEYKNLIDNNEIYKKAFGSEFDGVNTNLDRITVIRDWYKKIRKEYGFGFGRRVPFASTAFNSSKDIFKGVQSLGDNGLVNEVLSLNQSLEKLSRAFPKEDCFKDIHHDLTQEPNSLQTVLFKVRESLGGIQKHLLNPNLSRTNLISALNEVKELNTLIVQVDELNLSKRFFSGTLNFTVPTNGSLPSDYIFLDHSSEFLSQLYKHISLKELRKKIISCDNESDFEKIINQRSAIDEYVNDEKIISNSFWKLIDSDLDFWLKGRDSSLSALLEKNKTAIDNITWLDGWLKYLYAKERLESGGFSNIKDYLLTKEYDLEYAKNVLNFACYQTIAQQIYKTTPVLSQKSGHEQSAIQKQFAEIDENLKAIQRKRVAAIAANTTVPSGQRGAKKSSYTEEALLIHEISKKTRHLAIRKLVERAGRAMQAYMPCFMMSPMAVAKYIPPGSVTFDLVIMDEASQVKQEYALSCFARGKTIAVVGDPKQLPPTNFFEKSTSEGDINEEEISVIQDSESILEAINGFTPKRMLQWHYRSRHESLIDFSNHHFYDSRLVVFPSPWDQSDEFGIKHHYIENGRFSNSVNQSEAREVVNAIKDHLLNSDESLGVVAMNSKQRDQIEAYLEAEAASDQNLAIALAENKNSLDPLFIKNLENVQGDERDVIFISFTYGPSEKGANDIPQRFGPINNKKNGWRRLNVLFTRSKKRMHVFTSMRSGQILVSDTSSPGVQALKDYLIFVETGRLSGAARPTGKEPDSDFEIAVIDELEAKGYECEPQLGVEGYFIDIAVRDPGMRGRYLMGIECDGATYHSAKSTRDRDRVRQSVLEGLGWNIKRIWSTDWFKNPKAEIKPIFDELDRLSTPIMQPSNDVHSSYHVLEEKDEVNSTDNGEHIELSSTYFTRSNIEHETLADRLNKFQTQVITKKFPNTDDETRLLRPDIFHRLLKYEPRDRDEFAELIPQYLRVNTDNKEANMFLDAVLEIIAEYNET